MTDLDHRLHRAARELREMPVEAPPLESLGIAPTRRSDTALPALLATMLLVAGGLVGFAVGRSHPDARTDHAIAAVDEVSAVTPIPDVDATRDPAGSGAPISPTPADRMRDPVWRVASTMSPRDEIALVTAAQSAPDVVVVRPPVRWS
jgi:hypothetical protein